MNYWFAMASSKIIINDYLYKISMVSKELALIFMSFKNLMLIHLRLRLQGTIYRPNSFVIMLRYCANLKAIAYESESLNGIAADKSHCVIVA